MRDVTQWNPAETVNRMKVELFGAIGQAAGAVVIRDAETVSDALTRAERIFDSLVMAISSNRHEAWNAAIEAAAKVCEGESLPDPPHDNEVDDAYDTAVRHCASAIRAIPYPEKP
jgi:hypothetical protein